MNFWDSSAIVPLLIEQEHTHKAQLLWNQSKSPPIVWWGTLSECASAIARLEREERITAAVFEKALSGLRRLAEVWNEIQPTSLLREKSLRLLRLHPLRSADSFQLAAALIASEDLSASLSFVCFDQRLIHAARREGFRVLTWEDS